VYFVEAFSSVSTPQTWHYGLVSEWWAAFNTDGPEIDYFGRFVAAGQPALDAGCGAGRLLLPWLRAGYDVDGSDVSADMIARCREQASADGFEPTLLVQPLHELDPPRRYRTIVVCGVFGLGTTRQQDEDALRRLHDCLEPGGTLLLDNEVPYSAAWRWSLWRGKKRRDLPEPWPPPGRRKRAGDGSEYELRARVVALDPLDQSVVLEMRADKWVDGEHVASEEHALTMRMYFRDELVLMLRNAGFRGVQVRGGYADEEPSADHDFLVYIASRSATPTSDQSAT
jgi:SAM-dependent methyltransferase